MGAIGKEDQDVIGSRTHIGPDHGDFMAEQGMMAVVDVRVAGFMSSV
jgi:hypothetical protein